MPAFLHFSSIHGSLIIAGKPENRGFDPLVLEIFHKASCLHALDCAGLWGFDLKWLRWLKYNAFDAFEKGAHEGLPWPGT